MCVLWFVVGGLLDVPCWLCSFVLVWFMRVEKVKRVVIAVGWDLWECFGRSGVPWVGGLVWFGWFGFWWGSALVLAMRCIMSCWRYLPEWEVAHRYDTQLTSEKLWIFLLLLCMIHISGIYFPLQLFTSTSLSIKHHSFFSSPSQQLLSWHLSTSTHHTTRITQNLTTTCNPTTPDNPYLPLPLPYPHLSIWNPSFVIHSSIHKQKNNIP